MQVSQQIIVRSQLIFLIHFYILNFIRIIFLKKKNFAGRGNGKIGKETYLEKHLPTLPTLGASQDAFDIYFEYDAEFGIPGAFYIKNYMQAEFFLVSVTLEDIPNHGTIQFVCNSWVYNFKSYKKDRIFFDNNVSSVQFKYYFSKSLQNSVQFLLIMYNIFSSPSH